MKDRHFTEIDLREMLDEARGLVRDFVPGRWIVDTRLDEERWEVIVEPDAARRRLVAITAYRVEEE